MVWWVYQAARASRVDHVFVASGDDEIADVCRALGLEFVRTFGDHLSGTDRVHEAALSLDSTHIISLQADEPMLLPGVIDSMLEAMRETDAPMTSVMTRRFQGEQLASPNCVFVEVDSAGRAERFTRGGRVYAKRGAECFLHVGLYGYRRDALERFTQLSPTEAERRHRLEQMRALDNGWPIQMVETDWCGHSVDTYDDLNAVRLCFSKRGAFDAGVVQ